MKLVLFAIAFVCVAVGFLFFTRDSSTRNRVNVLVGTSPVSIWSWDKSDESFGISLLPANVSADSVAYGRYTLEALWKLGFIDKKDGRVLARSLTDLMAISIPWFIGEGEALVTSSDPAAYGRQTFSWRGLFPVIFGKRATNMPLGTWFSFSWALGRALPDGIRILDLVHQAPVASETLPDQSVREFLDPQRLDVVLKGRFEDEKIRQEAITVGVYNTTKTPALGTYAARLLTQEGVLVVAVGNHESEIQACTVEGSDVIVKSRTAEVIAELFDCIIVESEVQERVDLSVRLGTVFAQQFASGN